MSRDGEPNFIVNDTHRSLLCIAEGRCTICGDRLSQDDVWFVGGHVSAFHPGGAFRDPPTHGDCGRFALAVCPYLALPSYTGIPERAKMARLERIATQLPVVGFVDHTMMPERPDPFVIARTNGYAVSNPDPLTVTLHPNRPWLEAETWHHGSRIEAMDGPTVAATMKIYARRARASGFPTRELPAWKRTLNTGGGATFPWR